MAKLDLDSNEGGLSNENFYTELKAFSGRAGVCDLSNFKELPEDWLLILSDVKNSTRAIQQGRYREVNLAGVSLITALSNAVPERELPFVFGGDGASFLAPKSLLDRLLPALKSVQEMVQKELQLELRIGIVDYRELRAQGYPVRVGKNRLSAHLSLAVLAGEGVEQAEEWLKKGLAKGLEQFSIEAVKPEDRALRMKGLECRWQPLKSRKGEILSVMIKVLETQELARAEFYREMIEEIELILGAFEEENPAHLKKLKLSLNPLRLKQELKIRSSGLGFFARLRYACKLSLEVVFGGLAFAFRLKTAGVDWTEYRKEVVQNSDFWKYDNMLRFVIDVGPVQKRALINCLEGRSVQRKIIYGLHSSKEALMTCLIFDRLGRHVHFIDGGDGGYAMAARDFKKKRQEQDS